MVNLAIKVANSEPEVFLAQFLYSLGGLSAGLALVSAIWRFRSHQLGRLVTGGLLGSYSIISILTADHIYRHILGGNAPTWQLWGALIGFSLGSASLIVSLPRRSIGVPPEPK